MNLPKTLEYKDEEGYGTMELKDIQQIKIKIYMLLNELVKEHSGNMSSREIAIFKLIDEELQNI